MSRRMTPAPDPSTGVSVRADSDPASSQTDETLVALQGRSVGEQQNLRHREGVGVGDREERTADVQSRRVACGGAVKLQPRWSAEPDHLDILPHDTTRVARPERFHRRFLRSEAAGEMRGRVPPFRTIRDLPVGKDAAEESFPVPFEHFRQPRDVREIDAETNDRHDRATA